MVEQIPEYLFKRADSTNTETPRECQLQAPYCAFKGTAIPYEVYQAVLSSAERRKEILQQSMDVISNMADKGVAESFSRVNVLSLAGAIALAEGINGPRAAQRRLDNLGRYLQGMVLTTDFGTTE